MDLVEQVQLPAFDAEDIPPEGHLPHMSPRERPRSAMRSMQCCLRRGCPSEAHTRATRGVFRKISRTSSRVASLVISTIQQWAWLLSWAALKAMVVTLEIRDDGPERLGPGGSGPLARRDDCVHDAAVVGLARVHGPAARGCRMLSSGGRTLWRAPRVRTMLVVLHETTRVQERSRGRFILVRLGHE